jgi:mono/diheme cytochrome c family protein
LITNLVKRAKGKGPRAKERNVLSPGNVAWTVLFVRNKMAARRPTALLPFALCLLPLMASCRQDMHDAPRYDPLEASPVLPKGSSAQPIVAGTVPRGFLREDEAFYTAKTGGQPVDTFPFALTRADLDRGEERFNIFCAPCHGRTGAGNGMVVQRGFRRAASLHVDRLRVMPVGYFYDVITSGFGVMPDYRAQIPPEDRWRIVAYVRALQLSRTATDADVPAEELQKLRRGQPGGAPAAIQRERDR